MKKLFKIILLIIVLASLFALTYNFIIKSKEKEIINKKEKNNMNKIQENIKLNIKIKENEFSAVLENNKTTQEFINMLPLEINMNDVNNNEKAYYLNKKLSTNEKLISQINNGDIMLYGNNCLVIFYETFNTSYSYTKMGKINNPTNLKEALKESKVKVLIELKE